MAVYRSFALGRPLILVPLTGNHHGRKTGKCRAETKTALMAQIFQQITTNEGMALQYRKQARVHTQFQERRRSTPCFRLPYQCILQQT